MCMYVCVFNDQEYLRSTCFIKIMLKIAIITPILRFQPLGNQGSISIEQAVGSKIHPQKAKHEICLRKW
eukprot:m.260258 g.260258  ORF g.260258 m.260258 type:complete len:69 (+) comp39552_c0_seq1:3-209(+)